MIRNNCHYCLIGASRITPGLKLCGKGVQLTPKRTRRGAILLVLFLSFTQTVIACIKYTYTLHWSALSERRWPYIITMNIEPCSCYIALQNVSRNLTPKNAVAGFGRAAGNYEKFTVVCGGVVWWLWSSYYQTFFLIAVQAKTINFSLFGSGNYMYMYITVAFCAL